MKGNKKVLVKMIEHIGSQKAAARTFRCTQQAISEWMKNGIPIKRAIEAESITNKNFTKEQLRPDIFRA